MSLRFDNMLLIKQLSPDIIGLHFLISQHTVLWAIETTFRDLLSAYLHEPLTTEKTYSLPTIYRLLNYCIFQTPRNIAQFSTRCLADSS
jgi:hypothetical protein